MCSFLAHGSRVRLGAIAPSQFGCIHGGVGMAQQQVSGGAIVRVYSHPHRCFGLVSRCVGQVDRLFECVLQLLSHGKALVAEGTGQKHHKFVATHAGDGVLFAQVYLKPLGYDFQQLVASEVAQRVIHLFEVVQIHKQDGKITTAAFGVRDHLADAVLKQGPVGQASQGVKRGQSEHLRLGMLQGRDVCLYCHVARQFALSVMQGRNGGPHGITSPSQWPCLVMAAHMAW